MENYAMKVTLWVLVFMYFLGILLTALAVPACEKAGGIMVFSQWGKQCVNKDFMKIPF